MYDLLEYLFILFLVIDADHFPAKKVGWWVCRICEEGMDNTQENIKNHLSIHAINLKVEEFDPHHYLCANSVLNTLSISHIIKLNQD